MLARNRMKELSVINKILYLINSICLLLLILSYLSPYISPIDFWPISFFGLLFPFFYIINSLFLLYWIFNLKRPVWANLIILLIGIQHIDLFIGFNDSVREEKNSFKILSYNVRLFNRYEWIPKSDIKSDIIDLIKREEADIVCIQESYNDNKIPKLGYKYRHIGLQNKESKLHMAIYSKYPQIAKNTVSIKGKKMNNTCIYSDIIINTDSVRVYNIHLASNWFKRSDYSFLKNPKKEKLKEGLIEIIKKMKSSYIKRAEQVLEIKKHMNSSNLPIIVCGDFNDTPLSYAYKKISNNLNDSFSQSGKGIGQTFLKIPALRIDYILHEKSYRSFNYKQYNEEFSDHYAISTELSIL